MKLKKALSLTLALALSLVMAVPAFAAFDVDDYEESHDAAAVFDKYGSDVVTVSAELVGAVVVERLPEGTTDPDYAFDILVFQFPENTTFTPKDTWEWGMYAELGAQSGEQNTVTLTGTEIYHLQLFKEGGQGNIGMAEFYIQASGSTAPAQPEQPTQPTQPEQPVTPVQPEQPVTPVQPEQPAQPSVPAAGTYIVKAGDTWSSICTNFYGNNAQRTALQRANKGVKLQPGAVVTLPDTLGNAARIPAAAAGAGEKLYTVKAGDTLGKIAAAEYGQTALYKAIFERNADRLKNANTIYEGQVIVLPAKG